MSLLRRILPMFKKSDMASDQITGMYDPFPVTGRTILWNEIDYAKSDFTGWSGAEEDHRKLFESPFSASITNDGASPKQIVLAFYDSVNIQRIGFGENNGGDFSNIKVTLLGSGGFERVIVDGTADNTKFTSRNIKVKNDVFNSVLIEFHTADPVSLSNIALPYATYGMTQTESQQPDGDFVTSKADGSAFSTSSLLGSDGVFLSDWIDSDGWGAISIFIRSDVASAEQGVEVEFTDDSSATTPTVQASQRFRFSEVDVQRGYKVFPLSSTVDGFRVRYTNGPEAQSQFYLDAALRVAPNPQLFNSGGAQVVGDFLTEVALGNIPNHKTNVKHGRNAGINIASAPEDIIEGGGVYTGFNATSNEDITVASTSTSDVGLVLQSGTATSTSSDMLIDSAATFVTNGVTAGDIVLNDSQGLHGIIISVDSETTVTVYKMCDGDPGLYSNLTGNSYRVATSNGSGAAVIRLQGILDEVRSTQTDRFVVLNGTTPVTTTVNAIRNSRAKVLLAGSANGNVGTLSATQSVTTANQFWEIAPGINKTMNAADTVPDGVIFDLKRINAKIVRENSQPGSAYISVRVRPFGEVFEALRYESVSTSSAYDEEISGGEILKPWTDFKITVEEVSANDTQASAHMEYLIVRQ